MTPPRLSALLRTSRSAPLALALAALVFGSALTARAQPAAPAPPASEGRTRLVTVDDVVQMALTNNLDILITKYTPIADQYALNGLFSAYDPALSVSATRALNTQPGQYYLGFNFPSYATIADSYSASLGGLLPFGLNYNLLAPLNQQTTPFSQYNSSPSLTLSQPLLKNSWIDNTRYQIQLSRKLLRNDQLALRLQMENSVNASRPLISTSSPPAKMWRWRSPPSPWPSNWWTKTPRKSNSAPWPRWTSVRPNPRPPAARPTSSPPNWPKPSRKTPSKSLLAPAPMRNGAMSLPSPPSPCSRSRKTPTFPNACAAPLSPARKCSRPKSPSKNSTSPSNTPKTSSTPNWI